MTKYMYLPEDLVRRFPDSIFHRFEKFKSIGECCDLLAAKMICEFCAWWPLVKVEKIEPNILRIRNRYYSVADEGSSGKRAKSRTSKRKVVPVAKRGSNRDKRVSHKAVKASKVL